MNDNLLNIKDGQKAHAKALLDKMANKLLEEKRSGKVKSFAYFRDYDDFIKANYYKTTRTSLRKDLIECFPGTFGLCEEEIKHRK